MYILYFRDGESPIGEKAVDRIVLWTFFYLKKLVQKKTIPSNRPFFDIIMLFPPLFSALFPVVLAMLLPQQTKHSMHKSYMHALFHFP